MWLSVSGINFLAVHIPGSASGKRIEGSLLIIAGLATVIMLLDASRVPPRTQGRKPFAITKLCKTLQKAPAMRSFANTNLSIHLWHCLHLLMLSDIVKLSSAQLSSITNQVEGALQPRNMAFGSFLMNGLTNDYLCGP